MTINIDTGRKKVIWNSDIIKCAPEYLHQRRLRQFVKNEVNVARSIAATYGANYAPQLQIQWEKGFKVEECVTRNRLNQLQRNRSFFVSEKQAAAAQTVAFVPSFRVSPNPSPPIQGSFVHSSELLCRIRPWRRPVIQLYASPRTGVVTKIKSPGGLLGS